MDQLSLGVISRSRKENEHRLAIRPLHVERIAADLRERVYVGRGYGERFGVPDEQLAHGAAGLGTREQLFADCDVILVPKPQPQDLAEMREGQVLWGWHMSAWVTEVLDQGGDIVGSDLDAVLRVIGGGLADAMQVGRDRLR